MRYIDASAIVAILNDEPERDEMLAKMESSSQPVTSVKSIFESAIVMRKRFGSCSASMVEVRRFLAESNVELLPHSVDLLTQLALTHDRYGKGTGHPAQLNLGDCFSYAAALDAGAGKIIYKGNDFAHTDLG